MNISQIVAEWPVIDGWSISPGVDWCRKGFRIRVGVGCTAGDWFTAGNGFKAGDMATGIANIGIADGWTKSLSSVDGVAYIGAGCRWFTLRDALLHWGNHDEDRRMTMCLLESAKAIAKLHGLRLSVNTEG